MNNELDDIFSDDWPEDHRSGVIAVVGRPNVGKSTLINRILGQKIAIVTNKPQTTRKQQIGIYTEEKGQILFVDTPGLHKPHNKLGEYMMNVAEQAIRDADVILWVLDASEPPSEGERHIVETLTRLNRDNTPVVLALNKADKVSEDADLSEHLLLIDHIEAIKVSALTGEDVPALIQRLLAYLPYGPRYYPMDQVSETNMRFIASEVVRESIIENTEQEIPYSVAVAIDEYKERSEDMTYISATVYVERDSQRGIIVGKNGDMIKKIGQQARSELEKVVDTRVYLDLHVKVLKNWRSNEPLLRRLGYRLPEKDNR
ncbi:MAG: GTPase Era [Anaerolineae bacterium]